MAALQATRCRLCINICNGHRSLYDEDGLRNEVYALTEKYFKPLLLNLECVDHAAVVCMECWRHIFEFHTFQQSILLAQNTFVVNKRSGAVVKLEVDEDEFGTIQTKSNASGGQGHNVEQEDLTNATTSTFCSNDDDADQQSEDVVKPEVEGLLKDRFNDSCSDEGDGQQFEAFVKSEVELIEYHITDYVSRDREVSTKNDRGFVTSDEESEEAHDPDAEWEGLDNPVGLFSGIEFDKHGNETTEPDSERSIGSFSSDDEIPLAVQTRQCKAEPSNAKSKFKHTVSKDNSNETKKMRKRKSFGRDIKQELHVSDAERSGERFNSDDELLLEETKRGSMQGEEEHLQEKFAAELDDNPQIKTKYKRGKIMSNKSKLKRPQTVQEYDDFIAQWRSSVECVICSASYTRFSLLRQHFDKQHPTEECYILCCQLKLNHRYEIEKHIRFHIVPNTFKCDKCYKCYTEKYSLQLHVRRKHSGKPKGAISDSDNKHTSQQVSKGHTCEECGKVYKTLRTLQGHMRKVHLPLSNILKCTICDQVCRSPLHLREHMGNHTGKYVCTCPFCPKSFKYRAALYEHLNREHPKEWQDKKKEKAELNEKQSKLLTHMSGRTTEATHTCPYCPKKFKYRGGLSLHLNKLHRKEWQEKKKEKSKLNKIHKCTTCGKVYNKQCKLLEHMASHTGEQNHICPYCPKTFIYSASLYGHLKKAHRKEWEENRKERGLRKHNKAKEEQVHKCHSCDKVLKTRQSLREHQAKHERKDLYTCTYCPKTFYYMSTFCGHLKKEHAAERQKVQKD